MFYFNVSYLILPSCDLQVYDLGTDGQGMSRVATLSQNSIVAAAGNIARYVCNFYFIYFFKLNVHCLKLCFPSCRTIDRSVFKPIVQISVIDRSESSDCHLLAVTHAGGGYSTVMRVSVIIDTLINNKRVCSPSLPPPPTHTCL